jgi:hypothetical protein
VPLGKLGAARRACYLSPVTEPVPTWRDFLPLSDEALFAQCQFDRFRASGPGGQKRNVTDSAVRLRHRLSSLSAAATESRSQHENRARALRRLRRVIAFQLRAPVDLAAYSTPEPLAGAVRPGRGILLGRRDARFLTAVASLFDLLEALEWRVSDAARRLGVSTASVGRFLAQDAEVLRAANVRRRALELRPLRPAR